MHWEVCFCKTRCSAVLGAFTLTDQLAFNVGLSERTVPMPVRTPSTAASAVDILSRFFIGDPLTITGVRCNLTVCCHCPLGNDPWFAMYDAFEVGEFSLTAWSRSTLVVTSSPAFLNGSLHCQRPLETGLPSQSCSTYSRLNQGLRAGWRLSMMAAGSSET